jgi:competence protein ComEC
MPFPFLFLALSLASGILASALFSAPLFVGLSGLTGSLALAWLAFYLEKNRLAFILGLSAAFFLGQGLYSLENTRYEQNLVRKFDFNGYADFYGRLYKSPSPAREKTTLFLRVEKIRYLGKEERTSGNLRVSVLHPGQYPSPLRLEIGDRIKVSAQVLPARDFRNFGEPRQANFRRNQKIHNHAVTKSPLLLELREKGTPLSIFRQVSSIRQKLVKKIEAYFSLSDATALSSEGAVLEALLLGERGSLDEPTTLALQRSGLFHLIAISGAHIAIISSLLFGTLTLIRTPKRLAYVILIFMLLFYALLVEGRPSVFRATIMTLAYLVGRLLWRKTSLLNTVAFSASFLLLINPFSLFDMGFELTFAATLSLILFFPRVLKFLPRLPLKITELFALSLTAQLGVLPFLARSFNRVAFSSLLLNLAAVPLTGLIMATGFVFLGLSLVSHFLAQALARVLTALVHLFLAVAHLLDGLPLFSYRIPTPPLLVVLGYFLFLLLALLTPKIKGQRLVTLAIFGVFLGLLVSYPFPCASSPALRLTFLDVGQGDSILVEFPGRKKMLVDGGGIPDDSFDIGETVVSRFLWSKGIKKLDYLVLTHAHPDHMNGLKAVARNFKIGQYWEAFSPPQSRSYGELKDNLGASVIQRRVFRGYRQQEGEVGVEVLHPAPEAPFTRETSNERSLVLRLSLGETAFLLPADVGSVAEAQILAENLTVRAQVLKSPHHGSRSSSSPEFLDRVRPEIVVVTSGRGNVYGFPNREVLERYQSFGAQVLRIDEEGAVVIAADGRDFVIRTARCEVSPG